MTKGKLRSEFPFLGIGKSLLELGLFSNSVYIEKNVNIAPIERRIYNIFEIWRYIKDANFDMKKLQEKLKVSENCIYACLKYLLDNKFVVKINGIYKSELNKLDFTKKIGEDFWSNPFYKGRRNLWLFYYMVKKKRIARIKDIKNSLNINKQLWRKYRYTLTKLDVIKIIGKGNWCYVYDPNGVEAIELTKINYILFNQVEEKIIEIVNKTKGISTGELQKELSRVCRKSINIKTIIKIIENLEKTKKLFCIRLLNKESYRRYSRSYVFPIDLKEEALFKVLFELSQGYEVRKKIYKIILNQPGVTIKELIEFVNITKMGIYKHIRILEKYKLIKSKNFDHKIHFYPYNYIIKNDTRKIINTLRIPFINEIAELSNNYISPNNLSEILKINRRYCRRILKEIHKLGLAKRTWKNNNWIYTIDKTKLKKHITDSEVISIDGYDFENALKKELEKRLDTKVDCRNNVVGTGGFKCEVDLSIKKFDVFIECKARSSSTGYFHQKTINELVGRMLLLRPKSRWILAVLGTISPNASKIANKWGIEIVSSQDRKILIKKLEAQIRIDATNLIQRRIEVIGGLIGKCIEGQ